MDDYPKAIADKINDIEDVAIDTYFTHGKDGAHDSTVLTFNSKTNQFGIWEITRYGGKARLVKEFGMDQRAAVEAYNALFVDHMNEMFAI